MGQSPISPSLIWVGVPAVTANWKVEVGEVPLRRSTASLLALAAAVRLTVATALVVEVVAVPERRKPPA
jgi:hypothetical protein